MASTFISNIKRFHRNNVATLRSAPLAEISGALGDLGTLLPLMITLAVNGSISLSTTLVFSGFFNLATGIVFGIPLPVQPMKAIAAAAIASHSSRAETVAAGSVTSAAVLLLAATGLLRWATRVIPVPVVKGIQLGAGLSLVISAGTTLLQPLAAPDAWPPNPFDNLFWAFGAFVLLVLTQRSARFPYALLIFAAGLALALVAVSQHQHHLPGFHPWRPAASLPHWSPSALGMGISQLPLTTLNSIIAASALAADLLPSLPPPSVGALAASVAAMNLAGCWFGAMPVCHGAGGLAAQYRFGARSGASIIVLGVAKILLGALCGESLLHVLAAFPRALLGVMVLAAGLELARVGQSLNHGAPDLWEESAASAAGAGASGIGKRRRAVGEEERARRWTVMLVTAAGILAFKNDAVGFAAGMLCHYAYALTEWAERKAGELRRRRAAAGERAPLLGMSR